MANIERFLLLSVWVSTPLLMAQHAPSQNVRTVPTFTGSFSTAGKSYSYTLAGKTPNVGGTTTIPTIIVPIALSFEANGAPGSYEHVLSAAGDIPEILRSPLFKPFPFATGDTQYADAVQRAQFPGTAAKNNWHTMLGTPQVAPAIQIDIPAANGYVLHSQRSGKSLAVVDLDFVQNALFQRLSSINASPDKLLIAVTENAAFYSLGDATVCCSLGTHGAQLNASGTSAQAFVIASYMNEGAMPHYTDIQGLS